MRTPTLVILLISLLFQVHNTTYTLLEFLPQPKNEQDPTPADLADLADGFISGLEIFNNLPTYPACKAGDIDVVEDIVSIITVIKDTHGVVNWVKAIPILAENILDIYNKLNSVAAPCKELAVDIQAILGNVLAHIKSPEYIASLPLHVLENLSDITTKAQNASQLFDEKQYKPAGNGYGELIHFIFLWDFK
jgi:hypothetical protein